MARVNTYLNFPSNTEEAFTFYKSIFNTEFAGKGLMRFGDMSSGNESRLTEAQKQLIMHVALPITGGHMLMGSDAPPEMGFKISFGNNVNISIEPDTREEAKRLFELLSQGGKTIMPLQDMFWGAYFGSCSDKFGVSWMVNCTAAK